MFRKLSLFIFLSLFTLFNTYVSAAPLADMEIEYEINSNGTYDYEIELKNMGPILEGVTTPPRHTVTDWSVVPPVGYRAGGKFLTDDENIVLFGLDLGRDDIVATNITARQSIFHGMLGNAWQDSDGNGIANKAVAFHLPFSGWTSDDTIKPGQELKIRFTLDKEVTEFMFWVGGSDDAFIWDDSSVMIEDDFGIYDATRGEYLATFSIRTVKAEMDD